MSIFGSLGVRAIGIMWFVALTLGAQRSLAAQSAADAKGKYLLARIGDTPVPAAVSDAKTTWSILDGWIELYGNGSWLLKVNLRSREGRKKASADFGNVSRVGDSLTFTSSIYGKHGAALTATTLELSYDIAGDSTSERLVFARPGIPPQTVAGATAGGANASTTPPSGVPPAAPATPPSAGQPPVTSAPSAPPSTAAGYRHDSHGA